VTWTVLHIIAYAISGAFVALQAKYSFIGIFVLGLTTSYGGSIIHNIVLDILVSNIWERQTLLVVLVTLTTILFVKTAWISSLSACGVLPANKSRITPPPTQLNMEARIIIPRSHDEALR